VLHTPDLVLVGSVVADLVGSGTPACSGSTVVSSSGYSWVDDSSCALTDSTDITDLGGDPMLGPLADNGGLTSTMLPDAVSPLVDAIPSQDCPVSTDQRGVIRPHGSGCDIGAVERE